MYLEYFKNLVGGSDGRTSKKEKNEKKQTISGQIRELKMTRVTIEDGVLGSVEVQ